MAIVHLMRHGQTTYNVEERFSGRGSDPELTEHGINIAYRVGEWLKSEYNISLIVSSNMTRTNQTAEIVNQHLEVPILYNNDLKEKDKGIFEGKFISEALHLILELEDHEAPPGGESEKEFKERMTKAICPYLQIEEDIEILLVSHGYSARVAHEIFLEQKIEFVANNEVISLHSDHINDLAGKCNLVD